MLEDQVAFLLQKYLGNYVRGLSKEALKISVWKGNVELTNMQLKPEALNALKLPVKVKAGFLGSVKLTVPWSRLGQEPVLVYLDRIFILAEPATEVEGCTEDTLQEAKRNRVREMEMRLLESRQQQKSEMNTSWLGSLINTIIGNLKLSITNIHIRYEDPESNPGHPFAAGLTLKKLSAVTVDDAGKETFVTGGSLERIHKYVELDRLALYFDSDVQPWKIDKPWEDLLPPEWSQIFEFGSKDGSPVALPKKHSYILQPVSGYAKYGKMRLGESRSMEEPLQRATVYLDDVTLCLSKDEYRDILKLADNFASFNHHLKYAHYRPRVRVKSDPVAWWKYAYKVVADQIKKASGKLSWEQVLRYARLRKRYISLYASLLKSDTSRLVVDNNKEIEELDRQLDIELILQWRMLAHKFLEQTESDLYSKKPQTKKSWWSLGWSGQSGKNGGESRHFSEEDWEQLNKIIGYKEGVDEQLLPTEDKGNMLDTLFEVHMRRNASKLMAENQECLAELSCEGLDCSVKIYSVTKIFDLKLSSYCLSSPNGLLAESATNNESLVGVFSYKPFDAQVDWSLVGKASPCYITYLKDTIDQIISFFESSSSISQTIALETAAAVQMTIDEVKRTAQQQVTRALKDRARFFLDLDIAAPKITIPTMFCPDDFQATKLLLDLGNFTLRTQDDSEVDSLEERDLYLQFNLGLKDISAFLVDGDYHWGQSYPEISSSSHQREKIHFLPVMDKCEVVLKLQQIRVEHPQYPPTRLAVRVPSLGFHFSPARYHRLMQVAKIFQNEDSEDVNTIHPWNQADFEGWSSLLAWKGVGNREAVWQRRYFCLVGPFLYILENPASKTYKQYLSVRGKQVLHVPAELAGNVEHVLAICDVGQSNVKVADLVNALVVRCDSDESRRTWQSQFQRAIYRASASAGIASLSDSDDSQGTQDQEINNTDIDLLKPEKLFVTGVLDELRVRFSCDHRRTRSFKKILLAKESGLLEFRAIGGQVELSIRSNDMLIGTVLKSLEVEDLFGGQGVNLPRFLAKSFIGNRDDATANVSFGGHGRSYSNTGLNHSDVDDKFFEAAENLAELNESGSFSEYFSSQSPPSDRLPVKLPSFSHISGLLPDAEPQTRSEESEIIETLDSFVKAQIIIHDQDSPSYNNIDKQVTVTLATLSFFCYRPTIVAILAFVNAINIEERKTDGLNLDSATPMAIRDTSREDFAEDSSAGVEQEAVVKGLLGKGKSRVVFALTLNMTRAQILLMKENGTQLATLSMNNLHTDIKVFPSSFSIKAALGNLKISDDNLSSSHLYYWICDMRNPGGSSFVELDFSSFNVDDEDYRGYDYSLVGQLSEVRFVYLNRFVQELVTFFMGLVPSDPKNVVKLKDRVTDSEKWFTTSEIEGSPAFKLDLSLRKPIILMPRRTDSPDYLELDVLYITVQNKFEWLGGDKNEMGAVHLEMLTLQVKDINLAVGSGMKSGDSIIQDIKGLSVIIRRPLRDLLHQIPTIDISVKIDELRAALSNKEYQIISECALSNISEDPNDIPPLDHGVENSSDDEVEQPPHQLLEAVQHESQDAEGWTALKISVSISLVELSLHFGVSRDATLATLQISGVWFLYKSSSLGDGLLFTTVKGLSIIDDREGTQEQFRLAIGKPESINYTLYYVNDDEYHHDKNNPKIHDSRPVLTMLILDVKFSKSSTTVSVCVQRPQLLVALDFLLATVEFFVPTVRSMLSNEEDYSPLDIVDAIILDQPVYVQPAAEFSLSPRRPLVVDDENFDHFVYDGKGGNLLLQDRQQVNLCSPSTEAIIFVGNGKSLQFKNVFIKNGEYLDSCIWLGTNSSYLASEDDNVFLERIRRNEGDMQKAEERTECVPAPNVAGDGSAMEFIIELQAIGPELTFYNSSKDVGKSAMLSNKLLHAQLDAFSRIVLKGDTIEVTASVLGLTMESNGISILEPFDTSVNFSSSPGKTKIQLVVSEIFMNFSFSILRLFLAVEEDILVFLRMTSKKVTVVCSEFDRVGTIQSVRSNQTCAFWRPRAPPGFAVLGDCLTPLNESPKKGVLAVNTSFARVKRPVSFKLIWSSSASIEISDTQIVASHFQNSGKVVQYNDDSGEENDCSIWFPVAPEGYVSLGCVVSTGRTQPPLSSALCIMASLVSPCALKDCITLNLTERNSSNLALWRVDNSIESFLPADPSSMSFIGKVRELRHMIFGYWDGSSEPSKSSNLQDNALDDRDRALQAERSAAVSSGRQFETIASFRLVWWNQGTSSRKKLSIWRPVVTHRMIYLGDIAVQGYEPPNSSIVLYDDETILKAPVDFQLVGHIKKQRGVESISFWFPQAPPGFVALGCIVSKNAPKHDDFSSLRCIRSDMVTGDQFPEESIWDTSNTKNVSEPFSIWVVGNEVGTFLVRAGFKKPPKRLALKLVDPNISSQSDDTIIGTEIKAFSAALFDDYGGLMVPLFNCSLSSISFSFHGKPNIMNSTVGFSLIASSYNDKYDSWEPLVEPVDGFLRYQYDLNTPGASSQLRVTSTRDLNLNVSVANANMILQACTSWNNLSQVHESYKNREAISRAYDGKSIIDIHHRKNYYIIPQNKLRRDIFIRATDIRGIPGIIRLPSGETSVKIPVSKNMLDSHSKVNPSRSSRTMVTIVIADAKLPIVEGLTTHQYTAEVRLFPEQSIRNDSLLQQQSARTCGVIPDRCLHSGLALVNWSETFFFIADHPEKYMLELIVSDMGKAEPIGFFRSPLKHIARIHPGNSDSSDFSDRLTWIELTSAENMMLEGDKYEKSCGRIRCAVLMMPNSETENDKLANSDGIKPGSIQISPTREGPWTTVRLNYAAPAAPWRLGNDVVASEVSVKDGDRFVTIRSLVSVTNHTDFMIDLRLVSKASYEKIKEENVSGRNEDKIFEDNKSEIEFFEYEKYNSSADWEHCCPHLILSNQCDRCNSSGSNSQGYFKSELPTGWEWVDDWHVDCPSVNSPDGWLYASDLGNPQWSSSSSDVNASNYARKRRWVRNQKPISGDAKQQISAGLLKPGEIVPLPLSGFTYTGLLYILQLRPKNPDDRTEYSWSLLLDDHAGLKDPSKPKETGIICISTLSESERLLHCPPTSGSSLRVDRGLWFCLSITATVIGKDINSDPIHDWNLGIKSPLSIVNFLPMSAEFSVLEKQPNDEFAVCCRGIFHPGETIKVYNADLRNPLYFSLLPQGGWLPIHEAVLISHPTKAPYKTISLRSSFSGRIVQVILDQNSDAKQVLEKVLRVYAPYWIDCARCPPLTYRLVDISGRRGLRERGSLSFPFSAKRSTEKILGQITEDEFLDGCTIDSMLNFKFGGLSVAMNQSIKESFGPVADLSPLGVDGSIDLKAYNADQNCFRLFISSKPCPYQSIPTKVISVRPFMTFTNRLGKEVFIKLSSEDRPKTLHPYDSRVSFVYCEVEGSEKLQVRLEDTAWCFPVEIVEDTITMVLRKNDGARIFLRAEIRGFEEGSRFLIVFRLGPSDGPIKIENRTIKTKIAIRQSGLSDDVWIQLRPFSTTNFAWEDPCGQKLLDVKVNDGSNISIHKFSLDNFEEQIGLNIELNVVEVGDIKVARFSDAVITSESNSQESQKLLTSIGNWGTSCMQSKMQSSATPMEFIVELGVVGVSLIDHRPRELLYLYLERVFVSYSTGFDGGTTSRFKLILGYLQLDNQLPLTLLPVLLAPEHPVDTHHPVFKMTITMSNEDTDGTLVFPYIYIRVTEKYWRISIHEPIIWALMDFYNNLRIDQMSGNSNVAQVDPEIRVDLIDVSEVRLKIALETSPTERPHGALGVWSPVLSAVGNALKIQIHLRKIIHKNRFIRKSKVIPSIVHRIWRDLIHNPLHLIFSVDVLGMTSSTLASLSKGFAELSTDGQFLQLRSKQVWSRRITGVSDGFIQGTEALAQGVAFGVSGFVKKPMESARQHGVLGFAHGLGRAFLGFIVQPVSGALDFFSLTVDGIGASCTRCLEVFNNKTTSQRIRCPRAIHADGVLREYCEREAIGQMILHLAEASRHFGCTEIFKEPSIYAWSDFYEDHFFIPQKKILLITNKRVMLLQCLEPDKVDKKPCKIIWDVPWEELLALELAKAGNPKPTILILHLKNFKRSEPFVRVVKCNVEEEEGDGESQAVRICLVVRKIWKAYQSIMKSLNVKVPSSQRRMHLACSEGDGNSHNQMKPVIRSRDLPSSSMPDERKSVNRTINFKKIWSSEQNPKGRFTLCPKQAMGDDIMCSIWSPICPDGYVSVGDIARVGIHPPNVAAVYRNVEGQFALPMGYDLVWRNCPEDYVSPMSIWYPRPPEGYVSIGCVAVADFSEPESNSAYCVSERLAEETVFEEQMVWKEPESYPWACYIYQVQSEALHFVSLRQPKEESEWKPMRISDQQSQQLTEV